MKNKLDINIVQIRCDILEIIKSRQFSKKELYNFSRVLNSELDFPNWIKYDLKKEGENFELHIHHYYSSKEYTIFYTENDNSVNIEFFISFVIDESIIPKDLRKFLVFLSENLTNLDDLLFVNIDHKKNSQEILYKKFIKNNFNPQSYQ